MTNPVVTATLKELDELVGLGKFKMVVQEIGKMAEAGEFEGQPVNFAFTGNPGAGKVALARIIGEMLYRLGVIHKDQIFGVYKADLAGGSLEETLAKTGGVLEKARGGILYVDQLGKIFELGMEPLYMMLNARDTMLVLSGTREELDFLMAQPPVAKKANFRVEFPDYTPEELLEVAKKITDDYQLSMTSEAEEKLLRLLISKQTELGRLGNTRYVKEIIDRGYRSAASRLMLGNDADKILPEDIRG